MKSITTRPGRLEKVTLFLNLDDVNEDCRVNGEFVTELKAPPTTCILGPF
jgi:hypothetical protein